MSTSTDAQRDGRPAPEGAATRRQARLRAVRSRRAEAALFDQLLTRTVVLPLVMLALLAAFFGGEVVYLRSLGTWVDHADRVISKTTMAQKLFLDAETGLRGYLLTGEEQFLQPYAAANAAIPSVLSELKTLVADNPEQRGRIETIDARWPQWATFADQRLVKFRERGEIPRQDVERGKNVMDSLRKLISDTIGEEEMQRDDRLASANQASRAALLLGALLSLGVGTVIAFIGRRQLLTVSGRYEGLLGTQREQNERLEHQEWISRGEVEVAASVRGDGTREPGADETAVAVLEAIGRYVEAAVGAVYVLDRTSGMLVRRGGYAAAALGGPDEQTSFARGESWIGRVAVEGKPVVLADVAADHVKIISGTGQSAPRHLVIAPLSADGRSVAVVELGFLRQPEARVVDFLVAAAEGGGTAIRSAEVRAYVASLLEEMQRQTEELQVGQEELRVANEELEEHARALQKSNARLEEQQKELEAANRQLEEQAQTLEDRRDQLEATKVRLLAQAEQLTLANQFKSEFLANMSHELRTPLNSSLILAKLLAENKDANLTPEQVRFAQTIYAAGNDLLALINDILDLSRIEAGQLELHPAPVALSRTLEGMRARFAPLATEKGLRFELRCDPSAPATIETDGQRLRQILTNLLSNAIKFTDAGEVELEISAAGPDSIVFAVRDTGIGIEPDKQALIFDAFRQADGSTHRQFGGTGLGLTISRDLAHRLGGDIEVRSARGEGATFRLLLPRRLPNAEALAGTRALVAPVAPPPFAPRGGAAPPAAAEAPDGRAPFAPGSRSILVVEDDDRFARILADLAREQRFECITAATGAAGLDLASRTLPSAIVLDLNLPDGSGLTVLERLKRERRTRHIPVHVFSVLDASQRALELGAVGYALKPVQREEIVAALQLLEEKFKQDVARVLVVEDVAAQRESLLQLLRSDHVEIVAVADAASALEQLRAGRFDCMVLDLGLPDMSGYELLERLSADAAFSFPPVIVYTGRQLSADEEMRLRRYSSSVVIKGARSPERLLDEVTLFLHRVEESLPREQQRMLRDARSRDAVFEGRRILLVEDDVRNIFALTSVLEPRGAVVEIARDGREALDALERSTKPGAAIDIVLMDVMMPGMDGLAAMREIRRAPHWTRLPIIALTAKATAEDREICLGAGASDYIAKPIDVDKLISLVRVWMPR